MKLSPGLGCHGNGTTFKAAVTQGVSKALGIEYHLHCSWRPQSSGKVEKANDIIERHLHKLTQEMQDNWIKVLSIALTRPGTAPKKERLSLFECIYGRLFLHIDIVIDPEALDPGVQPQQDPGVPSGWTASARERETERERETRLGVCSRVWQIFIFLP